MTLEKALELPKEKLQRWAKSAINSLARRRHSTYEACKSGTYERLRRSKIAEKYPYIIYYSDFIIEKMLFSEFCPGNKKQAEISALARKKYISLLYDMLVESEVKSDT